MVLATCKTCRLSRPNDICGTLFHVQSDRSANNIVTKTGYYDDKVWMVFIIVTVTVYGFNGVNMWINRRVSVTSVELPITNLLLLNSYKKYRKSIAFDILYSR